jgi:hypothetical protein
MTVTERSLVGARRSRSRRGAAFVEALIVISMLTLGFLGLVFFREMYVKQLRVTRLARASMMTYAMTGCGNDNQPSQWVGRRDLGTITAANASSNNQTAVPRNPGPAPATGSGKGASVLGRVGGGDGSSILNPVGVSDFSGNTRTQTRQGLLGPVTRFQARSRSRSFVSCSDPPRNGGFMDAFEYITGIFP